MRIKAIISISDWNETPENVQQFIIRWKEEAGYARESPLLNFVQCIEILSDVTRNMRKDDWLPSKWFQNMMENENSIIAFDGDAPHEPIDTLYWEIVKSIKHLFAARNETL